MKKQFLRKAAVLMMALALTVSLAGLVPAAVHAENFQFITGVKLASGEEGMEKLFKIGAVYGSYFTTHDPAAGEVFRNVEICTAADPDGFT